MSDNFCDPNINPGEEPRLNSQCKAILERLKMGPATNSELSGISLKYTGRISDLRKRGYEIKLTEYDRSTGLATYELLPPSGGAVQGQLFGGTP